MRKTLTTLALAVIAGASFAQQDAQFSQNMFNKLAINPGFAGTNKAICGTALYRTQWVQFPGAPKTGLVSLDAYVNPLHGGVGLTVCSDQLGFDKTLIAKAAYSYHMVLGPGVLGIGLEAGMMQKQLSGTWITPDALYPANQDAAIPDNGVTKTVFDLGFGAYYTTDNGMYFGLSSTHLPQTTFTKSSPPSAANALADIYNFKNARHYYIQAGYPFTINQDLKVIPSILAKYDGTSTQLDINGRVVWRDMVWAGASYRLTDAIVGIVGFEWKKLKIGYAFDFTTSAIKNYSNNTHEIMVGYCFKPFKPPVPAEHRNVRFL
jgi:type IX secretion system PorP/SprF family membrane protein